MAVVICGTVAMLSPAVADDSPKEPSAQEVEPVSIAPVIEPGEPTSNQLISKVADRLDPLRELSGFAKIRLNEDARTVDVSWSGKVPAEAHEVAAQAEAVSDKGEDSLTSFWIKVVLLGPPETPTFRSPSFSLVRIRRVVNDRLDPGGVFMTIPPRAMLEEVREDIAQLPKPQPNSAEVLLVEHLVQLVDNDPNVTAINALMVALADLGIQTHQQQATAVVEINARRTRRREHAASTDRARPDVRNDVR